MEQQPTMYTPSICSFRMPFSGGGGDGGGDGENWRDGFEHGVERFEKHSTHAGKWASIFASGSIIAGMGAYFSGQALLSATAIGLTASAALPAIGLVASVIGTAWCLKKAARCVWYMQRSNQYVRNKAWKGTPHKEPRMKKPSWFKGWFSNDWGVGQRTTASAPDSTPPHDLES